MRRLLTPTLLMFLLTTTARANLTTGYALGVVDKVYSFGPGSYPFTIGESVYLQYGYEIDSSLPTPRVEINATTGGGYGIYFSPGVGAGRDNVAGVAGSNLTLMASDASRYAELHLDATGGGLDIAQDLQGRASSGFHATLVRVAGPAGFPVPEPSTVVLGAIGAGLLGLWRWRRGAP